MVNLQSINGELSKARVLFVILLADQEDDVNQPSLRKLTTRLEFFPNDAN